MSEPVMLDRGRAPIVLDRTGAGVRIARTLPDLEGLADAWTALAGRSAPPMQGHDWAVACAGNFVRRGDRLHVVTVGPEDRPTAIAPLVRRRSGRLELLGGRELYEPTDFLAADRPALDALAASLARLGRPIGLHRLDAGSPTIEALSHAFRGRGLVMSRPVASSPTVLLEEGWRRPETMFDSHARSNFRRRRKRLEESSGPLRFEFLSPSPDELAPLLEEVFRVEASGWKGRGGTALAVDAARGGFFRDFARAAAREGVLRIALLRVDGRAIAVKLGVERGGRYWLLKSGYDEAFEKASPSALLTLHMLGHLAGLGLESLELMGVLEPAKRSWKPVERPCVTVRTYPYGTRGLALLAADGAQLGLSRLRKRASHRGTSP